LRGAKNNQQLFAKYAPLLAADLFRKYPATDMTESDTKWNGQLTAMTIAGDYKLKTLEGDLKSFIDQGSKIGMNIRTAALRALLKIDLEKYSALGGDIIKNDPEVEFRRRVVATMAEFPGKTLNKVLDGVSSAPMSVQQEIVLALAGSSEGKDIIFRKVKAGQIVPRTLVQARTQELILMNASRKQQDEFNSLTADLPAISEEKQKVINERLASFESMDRKKMSLDSGAMVFQQNCSVCHKLNGQMGVAPQLDGIGKTGARGLIEKILDPNRNISKAFQNYTIKLKDGSMKSGLLRRDEGSSKVYADITGKEFTIAKSDIAEEAPSKFTLMPDSFESTIPEKDLYQLVNYLLNL
jgi:putative heme-binding domain-containing protein